MNLCLNRNDATTAGFSDKFDISDAGSYCRNPNGDTYDNAGCYVDIDDVYTYEQCKICTEGKYIVTYYIYI